jgi:predicted nucleotide-binding protein (sugar kinase/HSP70/actin superfamily)
MKVRVGIPRALVFYQYYPMWRTFFETLGAEVVTSPPTTRVTLAAGVARMVAETCLPVKVYCGHVLDLVGRADLLFIPSLRSLERNVHNCAKFLGLPDLVRAVVKEAPEVLDVDIDLGEGRLALYRAIYEVGRRFTWNPLRVKEASEAAWGMHLRYLDLLYAGVPVEQAIQEAIGGESLQVSTSHQSTNSQSSADLTIAVVGHPYNVFDRYVCHDVLRQLTNLGVVVRTAAQVPEQAARAAIERLAGRPYWTYEGEVVGAAGHYFVDPTVHGVILVVAFGCGPDSVMIDVVQRGAQVAGKPFMVLTIDEHTGEAGLVTRLEAFVDMLVRRER